MRPALVLRRLVAAVAVVCAACGSPAPVGTTSGPATAPAGADNPLERVALIHGGTGPWAVAGYRMGAYALSKLGLAPQSFDLEVVHHTPQDVQFSCIADGAAAATGASVGKLNLHLVDATEAAVATTFRRRSTGRSVVLRPTAAFAARFRDVPRADLAQAGRALLSLPDADIFEELPLPAAP